MIENLEKHFTKKELAKLVNEAWKSHNQLIKWLYDNHKKILRKYEDKYHKGLRIEFLGVK